MDKYISDKEILRYSRLTGRYYNLVGSVRILNTAQATFYMSRDVFPLDIYISKDFKNDRKVLVFLFSREETKELYDEWCSRVGQTKEKDNETNGN